MSKAVILIFLLLIFIAAPWVLLSHLSTHTAVTFNPAPKAIGESTPVSVNLANPHGLRHMSAFVEQNGTRYPVSELAKPANRLTFWKTHEAAQSVTFDAGRKAAPGLKEGKAKVIVEAQSNDFSASTDAAAAEVDVIFRPPTVTADGTQHYINQGGSELVLFTPAGSWSEAGVRAGDRNYRSFPVPGSPNERLSLFAFPWDMPRDTEPVVYVKSATGQVVTAHFWTKIFPKKFHARDFAIDDKFLDRVVNQIEPGGSGDLLARFLKINGEMRRQNNQTIADLRLKSEPKFLWTEPFLQMANSKVESGFADVRSYIYKGKKVDQQTHLGFDLAVSQHTPVKAANDGKVLWAAMLGIYGNCIVIDHGFGLQSIYGHLSELGVKEGQMVKRGEIIGKSGSTGLAGGDHLHFSMQVDGVQVNPIEWWDEHWIKDHVFNRIAAK